MRAIDLEHLGRDRVICCWEVDGLLVDPGPASTLDVLLAALEGQAPRGVLLTHVHLDHAGAAGALVARFPELPVWVHERGARHLVDPSRLLASATRIYGDEMDRLWGEVLPVPAANVRPLAGGERVEGMAVLDAPGHASHHLLYLEERSGRAFVGDVAGVRIPPAELVIAPTPPPDIDLAAWRTTLDALEAWGPRSLALTHFGAVDADVPEHLARLREALDRAERSARREPSLDDYATALHDRVRAEAGEALASRYEQAAPAWSLHAGLARWLQQQAQSAR